MTPIRKLRADEIRRGDTLILLGHRVIATRPASATYAGGIKQSVRVRVRLEDAPETDAGYAVLLLPSTPVGLIERGA